MAKPPRHNTGNATENPDSEPQAQKFQPSSRLVALIEKNPPEPHENLTELITGE